MGSLTGIMGALLEGGMGSLGADGLLGTFIGSAESTIQGALGSLGDLVEIGFGSIESFSAGPQK
ncbi:hypothetical protein [Prescottella agglutinans]|uniref:hypothetical protein n=1 Tax=Prescottella agglutinans TaxID=1644129 RepID=UPI000FDEEA80|nr:hypothetical protein [Prescottella agglutinans]